MTVTSNRSTAYSRTTIAIIGSGFSGSLVATHLLKTATQPLTIKLIERDRPPGLGVAYSTTNPAHLLNVSVGKMSAFPDDPGHLLRWLHYNRSELDVFLPEDLDASSFIPRQVYGYYIQAILDEAEATAASTVRLDRIRDEAIAIEPQGRGALVSLLRDRPFQADSVVLALGNTAAESGPISLTGDLQSYVRQAWSADALINLEPEAAVLIVGTGLTMVDMVVSLRQAQHQGPIYATSRRGLLPLTHAATKPYPAPFTAEAMPSTVRGIVRQLRQEIQLAADQGVNWRSVMDALRPVTQQLWQQLPPTEQQRFLRHASPYWDVHRHRIAPQVGKILQAALDSGQLQVLAGRIQSYQIDPGTVAVTVRQRYTHNHHTLKVSRIINCTGAQIDYRRSSQLLIANLRDQGLIHPNAIGLGIDTAANGAILDIWGHASSWLYTLGTPRKGNLWESTAVPELRQQAQALASTLLQSLPIQVRLIPSFSRAGDRRLEQDCGDTRPVRSPSTLLFRQFFDPESSTYTYLVADQQTREAVLVDPVLEQVERDLQVLDELGLTLRYCLETHIHADHITGAGRLRQQTGCRVLVPQDATARSADHSLADRELLLVGAVWIEAIATPGHTSSHMAYLINTTHLLTGDALLIRGCGRTDLQGGDAGTLYDRVTQRLFSLPDETLVYPAHDYKGRTASTIGEEKRLNPRFADRSREQFITIMSHLGLSFPKKMHEAVPANEYCGDFIPGASLNQGTKSDREVDRKKVEQTLSTNTEIYEDYFAMYI